MYPRSAPGGIDQQRALKTMSNLGNRSNIGHFSERIGRCLGPHKERPLAAPGRRRDRGLDCCSIGEVHLLKPIVDGTEVQEVTV